MEHNNGALYVIYDNQADSIVGGIVIIAKNDTPAIRDFTDALQNERSQISKHPKDYDLVCLGYLNHHNNIHATDKRLVLTGEQWLNMQQANNTKTDNKQINLL